MGQASRKFQSRAPRYLLRPGDDNVLRFAGTSPETSTPITTRIVDISVTGLAFVCHVDLTPKLGEILKVEFPSADGKTLAWWAKVVRIEMYEPHRWYMKKRDIESHAHAMVAARFQDLPAQYEQEIKLALDDKFDGVLRLERKEKARQITHFVATQFWRLFLYALCATLTFWFLWHFSRPSDNYDAKIGSPWGQRFKVWNPFDVLDSKDKTK
jgi:hypothetical protein